MSIICCEVSCLNKLSEPQYMTSLAQVWCKVIKPVLKMTCIIWLTFTSCVGGPIAQVWPYIVCNIHIEEMPTSTSCSGITNDTIMNDVVNLFGCVIQMDYNASYLLQERFSPVSSSASFTSQVYAFMWSLMDCSPWSGFCSVCFNCSCGC